MRVKKPPLPLLHENTASTACALTSQVHGANWNEADELARSLVDADASAEYIPPYEHELLWQGHSSIIDEIAQAGERPGTYTMLLTNTHIRSPRHAVHALH